MKSGTPAHRHTGTPAHRHTGTPAHRHTGTPAHRHTGTPAHRHTGTPAHRHTGTPAHRHTGTPAHLTHLPDSDLQRTVRRVPGEAPSAEYRTPFRVGLGDGGSNIRRRSRLTLGAG